MKFKIAASLNSFLFRDPQHDFKDDGTSFKMYRYGDSKFTMPISFTSDSKNIYLCIRYPEQIPCDFILDKFQGWYPIAEKFNPMRKDDPALTIENIQATVKEAYEKVCKEIVPAWEAEQAAVMTDENRDLFIQKSLERAEYLEIQLKEIKRSFNYDLFLKLDTYEISCFKEYIKNVESDIKRLREKKNDAVTYSQILNYVIKNKLFTDSEYWITSLKKIIEK